MLDMRIDSKNIFVDGRLAELSVGVKNGVIVSIGTEVLEADTVIDAGEQMVLPGMADSHVHIREPGNSHRETFHTGTAAAINGGVTTVCEHPLASPPPSSLEILEKRKQAAAGELFADMAFMGAAGEYNIDGLKAFADSGEIIAFKTFLHAPVKGREIEFNGLTMCNDGVIYESVGRLAEAGLPWLVHAENNDMIQHNTNACREKGLVSAIYHARSRPPISEYETVAKILLLTEELNVPVLFCHISTPEACEIVKAAKARGRTVYLETCPHYLLFTEELLERFGSFAKCSPPLRTADIRDALWPYVVDGTVDIIGSDHAPYAVSEKESTDIFKANAGFPSIEARIPLMFTEMMRGRLSLQTFVDLHSTNIAKIFNLYPRKGTISVGSDADFAIFDQHARYTLKTNEMYTLSRDSAKMFDNIDVTGKITTVILRGVVMKENGKVLLKNKGRGQTIKPLRKARA